MVRQERSSANKIMASGKGSALSREMCPAVHQHAGMTAADNATLLRDGGYPSGSSKKSHFGLATSVCVSLKARIKHPHK